MSNEGSVVAEAAELFERGEYGAAAEAYRQAAESTDADASLYTGWGMALAAGRMYEQARWKLERAIEVDPRYAPAYVGLGRVLLALELWAAAEERFDYVARVLDPGSGEAFAGWGQAAARRGDFEEALKRSTTARELEAGTAAELDRWLDVAEALNGLHRYAEALGAYRNAIELEAKFGGSIDERCRARFNAALAALAANAADEALAYCEEGLGLREREPGGQPDAASLHYVAAAALTALKHYSDAIARFRQAAALSDLLALHSMNAIASVLAGQGKYPESWAALGEVDAAFERVERSQGGAADDEQRMAYGTALLWLDRLNEAETVIESALDLQDRNAMAWGKLISLYLERGERDLDRASHWRWKAYEAYRKLTPMLEAQRAEGDFAELLLGLGLLHLRMDDLDEAEALLAEARRLDGDSSTPLAGLGMIRAQRGQYADAIRQFELALKRDPDDLMVKCHLADAHFRLGHRGAALDSYEEILQIAPGNVGAHIGTGEILVEQAQELVDDVYYSDAEAHFTEAIDLAESVRDGSPARKGSSGLGMRQWADLRYSRGYVRVKIFEAQMEGRIGRPNRAARGQLEAALEDFEAAIGAGVNVHRAERAAERVEERLKRFSASAFGDSFAPIVVVAVASVLLLFVQVAFVAAGGFSGDQDVAYTTLTLSLVALLAAGFYLPQVLKLKLGGLELEKATAQEVGGDPLKVDRQPLRVGVHSLLEPSVTRNLRAERGAEKTKAYEDTTAGAKSRQERDKDSRRGVLP